MTKPCKPDLRSMLLAAGVKNLRTFGYPDVNAANILTDMVYRAFFRRMLEDNASNHAGAENARKALLAEMGDC